MRLTPIDILHKEFKRGWRGVKVEEVEEFKEKIAKDYEDLLAENMELKEKIKLLEEKLKDYTLKETALQNSLVLAEKTAEERLASARREAEVVMEEAKIESKKIKESIEEELKKTKEELGDLKKEKEKFLIEFESLLKVHLNMIEEKFKK